MFFNRLKENQQEVKTSKRHFPSSFMLHLLIQALRAEKKKLCNYFFSHSTRFQFHSFIHSLVNDNFNFS